ncbi:Unknown protein [Striga hermonthica]|uniref:Retrovirus-related Pol polyprotein from transposon TNT 1-94-like beta-barrel domain-containing protein n=1 Tax=Striga hermonthica TaxID=68872 RepID=A0A9N7MWU3_STRHE|nr:Unknown protein [Striga hermonthica]
MDTETLSFSTLIHMITIKLSSSNYLLWKNQILPLLSSQNLLGYIGGTKIAPPSTVTNAAGISAPNRAYEAWHTQNQRLLSLLLSSLTLTEESMAEVIGCSTSQTVWLALEAAYNHRSKSRELRLKDDLQLMKKGDCPISEYGRKFKSICDQLAAIGRPVDDTDKAHWFLRGLGSDFSSFSAAQMALTPLPTFRDLLSKAESFALFQESLASSGASNVAFYSQHKPSGHFSTPLCGRGNGSRGRGCGRHSNRCPPRCQICRVDGHYATSCPERYTQPPHSSIAANLAEAFSAGCSLSKSEWSDWFLDTGASAHMTPTSENLDSSQPYSGMDRVVVGNGAHLSISRIGCSRLSDSFQLLDVLVVPDLTKNLLSISKLTSDFPVEGIFLILPLLFSIGTPKKYWQQVDGKRSLCSGACSSSFAG